MDIGYHGCIEFTTYSTYLEGFLGLFTGADDDEPGSPHAAEALEVQPLQHWHGGHSIVLQSTVGFHVSNLRVKRLATRLMHYVDMFDKW